MVQVGPCAFCTEMLQMTFLGVGLQWISPSLVDAGFLDTGYDATLVQALQSGAHKYKSSLSRESNRWLGECTLERWKRERAGSD